MTNNEQDNLRQSIEALQDFWSNHGDYDIREKAREYIELYQSNGNSEHFSWVHPEDAPYIKENGCNAVRWGIPNQILGDIDKAKFIFGLFNPGTQMRTGIGNECKDITEYVEEEKKEERNLGVDGVNFESKEYSENLNFYLEHVISVENVMAQELKKLYKIFKEDREVLLNRNKNGKLSKNSYNGAVVKKIAYYLFAYYSKAFMDNGLKSNGFQNSMRYYYNLFEKIEKVKGIVKEKSLNYNVEQEFNHAVEKIAICNIEMIPYRSNGAKDIVNAYRKKLVDLPSTSKIASLITEKIIRDTDTIAVFRAFRPKGKNGWRYILERNAEEQEINFKENIKPSLFHFSNSSAALSKKNIKTHDSLAENPQEKVDKAVDALLEELKMQPFVDELNNIIEENS